MKPGTHFLPLYASLVCLLPLQPYTLFVKLVTLTHPSTDKPTFEIHSKGLWIELQ